MTDQEAQAELLRELAELIKNQDDTIQALNNLIAQKEAELKTWIDKVTEQVRNNTLLLVEAETLRKQLNEMIESWARLAHRLKDAQQELM